MAIKLSEFNHFKEQFKRKKFCRLPRIVPPHALALMFQASVLNRHHEGYMEYDEKTLAFGRYCDAMGEALLMMIHPMLEKRIGISLMPWVRSMSYIKGSTPQCRGG